MIKLCTNCHETLRYRTAIGQVATWDGYQVGNHTFCSRICEIQFDKLSNEEQKAEHYAWVREEALANSQADLDL